MIRAIVFDFYDTLVYRDFAATEGTRSRIAALVGVPVDRLNALWRRDRDARMLGAIATLEEHLVRMLGELGVDSTPELVAELAALEREGQRQAVHPYPNTVDVLRRLREMGFRLGMLSNTSDAAQEPIGHLKMHEFFDAVVLSHEVALLKPDPRIYHLVASKLDVKTSECAFVADGGFGELDAAHAVGMLAVKIEQDGQSADYGSSVHYDVLLSEINGLLALAETWRAMDRREL
jgi:putative hydrolase of the HAD superfamily